MPGFDADGEQVTDAEVIRYWLAAEREKTGDETALDGTSTRDALDELLSRKPGAAAFLWRAHPIVWSRITLSRPEFERLRLIGGPNGLLWNALSPDGTVMGAATRLAHEDPAVLAAETGVDTRRILGFVAALETDTDLEAFVLTKRRGGESPRIADGNHRATAVGVHLLRTGEYRPQTAYLGIGANPMVKPIRQRIQGVLTRLRSGPRW